jgi:integrase/recombinase XerD
MSALAPTLQSFFTSYLVGQRAASHHTIGAYRDTLRLLLAYVHERTAIQPSDLDISVLDAELIAAFLTMLEQRRGNSIQTRNARLAAIHSLYRHAALRHPEHAELIARVLAIPTKNHAQTILTYLTTPEIDALLASPPPTTWTGRRDHLLILVMITTGVRVSELTSLTRSDVHTNKPAAHIASHGKGRKTRITPLDATTTRATRAWLTENPGPPATPVFTARGTNRKMTTDAVAQRLKLHAATAARTSPTIATKKPDPAHPAPHLRDAHARLRDRRHHDRAVARTRITRIDTRLPPRRPPDQATSPRPHRTATHPPRPLPPPRQATRLPRSPLKLCRTSSQHRPPQRPHPDQHRHNWDINIRPIKFTAGCKRPASIGDCCR